MKINREQLLKQLEEVSAGLSPKEIIEQSNCFVFLDGMVRTYNDEVACTVKTLLKMNGAVPADPLLKLLGKMKEEEIEVEAEGGEFLVVGKHRKAGITMTKEVTLPIEGVDTPGKWKKLPEGFADAVDIVSQSTSRDESQFVMTCVHIHPEWLEACDFFQLTRYPLKMGVQKALLIRRNSLRFISRLGVVEFSETEEWFHFRNPKGLVLSCRRYAEGYKYPSLEKFLSQDGTKTELPKGMSEAVNRAEVFSAVNDESNQLKVELVENRLRLEGRGALGWYKEEKRVEYGGEPLSFIITPKLLVEIAKKSNECYISEKQLRVKGDKFTFVCCVGKPGSDKPVEKKQKRKKSTDDDE